MSRRATSGREQLQQIFASSTGQQRKKMMVFGAFGGTLIAYRVRRNSGIRRYYGREQLNDGCGIYRVS
jgi:hypothetical protein